MRSEALRSLLTDLTLLVPGTRLSILNSNEFILRDNAPLTIRKFFLLDALCETFRMHENYGDVALIQLHNFTSGKFILHAEQTSRWGLCLLDGSRSLDCSTEQRLKPGDWWEHESRELEIGLTGDQGASWLCVVLASKSRSRISCSPKKDHA